MRGRRGRVLALAALLAIVLPVAGRGEGMARPAADSFLAARPAAPGEGALARGLEAIRERALGAHVAFLAAPALGGRGLGTEGLEAAAEYVAAALAQTGLEPFGTDADASAPASWFQAVPLRGFEELTGEVEVRRQSGASLVVRPFRSGIDCRFAPHPPVRLTAPVVFAGHGIRDAEAGHDDYRGLDVRGKIVLILDGLPAGRSGPEAALAARWAPADAATRWERRREVAADLGAAALLAVETEPSGMAPPAEGGEGFFLPFAREADAAPPLVRVSPALADELLAAAALDTGRAAGAKPSELPGVTGTVQIGARERRVAARNVLAILRGSDPALRDEAVLLGAHLDHLGRVGGVVHPGADDNASGVAGLLEIARAFAAAPAPPRRTLVFAFWTGEEEGKLGSGFYRRQPRWPLARTVAYLNFDMIGYPWLETDVRELLTALGPPAAESFLAGLELRDFVAPGLPPEAPAVEAALRRAAAATGLALYLDFTDGRDGGSDYREFARAGIPFVRFVDNYGPWYHQSGDTPERLDLGVVARISRLGFATAWDLANPD